jgi:hypothetical protein
MLTKQKGKTGRDLSLDVAISFFLTVKMFFVSQSEIAASRISIA